MMKVEELSSAIANIADKLSDYHSRIMALEREVKNLEEVKNVEVKTDGEGERLPKT